MAFGAEETELRAVLKNAGVESYASHLLSMGVTVQRLSHFEDHDLERLGVRSQDSQRMVRAIHASRTLLRAPPGDGSFSDRRGSEDSLSYLGRPGA